MMQMSYDTWVFCFVKVGSWLTGITLFTKILGFILQFRGMYNDLLFMCKQFVLVLSNHL